MNPSELLPVAERVARQAGALALAHFHSRTKREARFKSDNSPVTDADIEASDFISAELSRELPGSVVISEEGPRHDLPVTGSVWIIDPVDGTSNFVSGNPYFSISIALIQDGVLELGVVFDPVSDTIYAATRGGRATRSGTRIHASNVREFAGAHVLLDVGTHPQTVFVHGRIRAALENRGALVESRNCASLELCAVASGESDAFIHRGLHAWDVAAGMLIAEEAGAAVYDLRGNQKVLSLPGIIAAMPGLASGIVTFTRGALDDWAREA